MKKNHKIFHLTVLLFAMKRDGSTLLREYFMFSVGGKDGQTSHVLSDAVCSVVLSGFACHESEFIK